MTLSGKIILLTGATGGIGRPTALLLAREGARVALTGRNEGRLRALEAEIKALGGDAAGFPADLRRAPECARVVGEAVRHFGGLDAVVNNAGVMTLREADRATDEEIEELIEINLLATIRVTRAALPALTARSESAIVNVGSYAGRVSAPFYSYYSASKFAVAGVTEGWRRELRPRGVRVTLYMPAAVATPLLDRAPRERALGAGPAGVVCPPEEAAAAIVRSLKGHPAEVYSPYWNRWLAWVNLMAPAFSDRVLNALFRYPRKK